MARFTETLVVPQSAEKTFAFLADFHRTAEWDPGVLEAQKLSTGPVAVGTRFRVVAGFLGRRVEMLYTVTQSDPPHRIVLRGESSQVVAEDEILVTPHPDEGSDSCTLTWDARLSLKGLLSLADPLLHASFQVVGRRAVDGLARALGARR